MKRVGDIVQVVHMDFGLLAGIVLATDTRVPLMIIGNVKAQSLTVRVFGLYGTDTILTRVLNKEVAEPGEPYWREVQ